MGTQITVQLAEQGIAIFLCPVGEVDDEVLDLLAGSFAQRLGSTEVHGIRLHQIWIQLMLPDDLAQAVANPRAISVAAVSVHRLRREPPGFAIRFALDWGRTRK